MILCKAKEGTLQYTVGQNANLREVGIFFILAKYFVLFTMGYSPLGTVVFIRPLYDHLFQLTVQYSVFEI